MVNMTIGVWYGEFFYVWQVIEYGVPKASVVFTDTQQKWVGDHEVDRSVLNTIFNKEISKNILESMNTCRI